MKIKLNKVQKLAVEANKGPILISYGLGTRNGIFIPSLKGIDFSFSLIFKTDFF